MEISEIEKKFASWGDDLPIEGYLTKLSNEEIKWLISRVRELEEVNDILKRHEAICNCGVNSSSHGFWDGHSFVEMRPDCPFEQRMKELEAKLRDPVHSEGKP